MPSECDKPPTIYSILNSYVNFDSEVQTKISDLAKTGKGIIFDFTYPLATSITKDDFEVMILNHFMMRRIGYDTVTAFKLALNVKLNEIMPMYNKLFNALNNWEIFEDGEVTTRTQSTTDTSSNTQNTTSSSNTSSNATTNDSNSSTSDRRFSDTPQTQLSDVQNGSYVTDYNYDTNKGTNSSTTSNTTNDSTTNNTTGNATNNGNLNETISRTPADKMKNYTEFIEQKQNVYTMIFKDLDSLFYQVI